MPDSYLLGLAHEHDAGVALFRADTGTCVYAANEERFNREKFTNALPAKALADAFRVSGVAPQQITHVAVGSRVHVSRVMHAWWISPWYIRALLGFLAFTRLERFFFGTVFGAQITTRAMQLLTHGTRIAELRGFLQGVGIGDIPLSLHEHHHAHAASAYGASGFARALVVTLDAQGDGDCSRVYLAENGNMTLVHRVPFFHSPGNYYEYVTDLLGFKPGREGKVTGLAARGNPAVTLPVFESRMTYDAARMTFKNRGGYRLREIEALRKRLHGHTREDIAAGVQRHLEHLVTRYIADAVRTHGGGNIPVVVAGGVFANVKLNQCVAELPEVQQLYIFPHMGDGGLAAGAGMAQLITDGVSLPEVHEVYLGPDIRADVAEELLRAQNLSYTRPENLADAVAERLAKGQVVATCVGRMEYGPRALGNRTILYQTMDPSVNEWLNKRLNRSEFMPFAPIMRETDIADYFTGWEKCKKALRYMTCTLQATDRCKQEAPAIVHVDGTARPQTVTPESNPFIHDVLNCYEQKTGRRILINTSFNMHEEPIVCSEADGIRAFLLGNLDVLAIGPFLVDHPAPSSTQ